MQQTDPVYYQRIAIVRLTQIRLNFYCHKYLLVFPPTSIIQDFHSKLEWKNLILIIALYKCNVVFPPII